LSLIVQAIDATGRADATRHWVSVVNPQGRIGIFTRSYCEEVLIVRVHNSR
jgi:polyphosphate kinase 2 (PPK2 family)